MHTREILWIGIRAFWKLNGGVHASPAAYIGYMTFPLVWGSVGVPIFFVLSGYCIHRSQAYARVRSGSYQLSGGNFLLRRFLRIYPVLVGALLLTTVLFHSVRQASLLPFIAALVAVIGCAYLFSLAVERPALAWSKRLKQRAKVQSEIAVS